MLAVSACGRAATDSSAPEASALASGPATGTITMWAQGAEGVAPPELVKEFESANPGVNATDYGLLLAGSVLVITPIVTLFVSLQRFFIQSVASTGVK